MRQNQEMANKYPAAKAFKAALCAQGAPLTSFFVRQRPHA